MEKEEAEESLAEVKWETKNLRRRIVLWLVAAVAAIMEVVQRAEQDYTMCAFLRQSAHPVSVKFPM